MATTRLMPLHVGKGRTVAEALGRTTDVDKEHIHSHIVFNSTALDCTRKFRNFLGSSFAVRKISDLLCWENGLSVIENPKPSRGSYGTWLGEKPPTVREQLERMIDAALADCKDFDSFLAALKAAGVEVKRGKHLSFKIPGGKKFVRCSSLGEGCSEGAIIERISGKRIVSPKAEQTAPNLLIDIQTKLQQAHSPGYERWASVFNAKEMTKMLNYLTEHRLLAYGDLEAACDAAVQKYHEFSDRTKANSAQMQETSELQKHIGAYHKTREVYAQYRKLPPKKQKEFYAEHASAIISCEAAKRYFDGLRLKNCHPSSR